MLAETEGYDMWTAVGEPIWLNGVPNETPFSIELAVRAAIMNHETARERLRQWNYSDEVIEDLLTNGL